MKELKTHEHRPDRFLPKEAKNAKRFLIFNKILLNLPL